MSGPVGGLQRSDETAGSPAPGGDGPLPAGRPRGTFRPPPPREGPAATTLFLGLNLVLLAFFVLLVAISHPEEDRTRRVLASLHTAFAAHVASSLGLPHDDGPEARAGGRPLEEASRLLRPSLPLTADAAFAGHVLALELDPDTVLAPGATEPRSEVRVLLRRLAFVLGDAPGRPGVRATLELVAPAAVEDAPRERARLEALARQLVSDGASPPRLRLALAEGEPLLRVLLEAEGVDG